MHYKQFSIKTFFYVGCLALLTYLFITIDYNFIRSGNKQPFGSRAILSGLTNQKPSLGNKRPAVIVLTYMRSGSSLLGDILQQSPGSFYLYEPLHSLGRVYTHYETNLTFVNGTTRLWPFNFLEEAMNIMRFWLKCDATKVLKRGLRDGFMEKGLRSRGFRQCYRRYILTEGPDENNAYIHCALELNKKCETSSLRVMKTIRMPMRSMRPLLDEFPGLKIIHLIRDPRATLKSQSVFGLCSESNGGFYGCTNRLCTRLENDILETKVLQKLYPERIKTMFYEHIASNPIEASKDLYQFIGTTFTSNVRDYVFNITQAGNSANCAICTTRPNSSTLINSWRGKIREDFLQLIEERCNYVLQRFNYTLYSNNSILP